MRAGIVYVKNITPTTPVPPINETYNTETLIIGFGVDLHFWKTVMIKSDLFRNSEGSFFLMLR